MAKPASDHVRIGSLPNGAYRLFCLHCGQHYTPALPISMDMMLATMKVFSRQHKTCKPDETTRTEEVILRQFDS